MFRYCIKYTCTHTHHSSNHLVCSYNSHISVRKCGCWKISCSLYPFPFSCHGLKKENYCLNLSFGLVILLWWYVCNINRNNQILTTQYPSIHLAHSLPSFFYICPLLLDSKSQLLTEARQSGNGVPRDAACVFRSRYWSGAACIASSYIA